MFTEICRAPVTLVKEARKTDNLDLQRNNSSKFWKTMAVILPNKKSSPIEMVFDPDKKELVGGECASNLINDYFSNFSIFK